MKKRSVAAKLFMRTDGQRHDEADSRFRNFANVPKNDVFVVYFVLLLRNWSAKRKGRMSQGQSCNTQHLHISIQKVPESGG
jgi:hypothetical protein